MHGQPNIKICIAKQAKQIFQPPDDGRIAPEPCRGI
jgi:hypothetical protein